MRQLRYSVAASLDGYIAGPTGEFDWIVIDPDIDFTDMYAGYSGLVMGRRAYEVSMATGGGADPAGIPLLTAPGPRMSLHLRAHRLHAKTGTLSLEYDVRRA